MTKRPEFPPHLQRIIDEQRARNAQPVQPAHDAHGGHAAQPAKAKKFHSKVVADHEGVVYESALERDVAADLGRMKAAGEIAGWTWAPRFVLEHDPATPNTLVTYRPDFLVWPIDGGPWYAIDAKGMRLATFNVKARLWKVRYAQHPLYLVRRVRGGGRETIAA